MRKFSIGILAISFSLSGCSIHPDTQDFSRDMTADIVFHVQCEAQKAINTALEYERLDYALTYLKKTNPRAFGPVDSYKDFREAFKTHLLNTGLTQNFIFTLTENDDLTSEGAVKIPISTGSFTLGWDAGAEKQRKTTQTIEFNNSFKELQSLNCTMDDRRKNFIYPITGDIGLQDTFNNFIRIAARQVGTDLSAFSDAVEFKTLLNGKISPSINLVPSAGRLITASADLNLKRTDQHEVTLTFKQAQTWMQKDMEDSAEDKLAREIKRKIIIAKELNKIPIRVQLVDATGNKTIDLTKPTFGRPQFDRNEKELTPGTRDDSKRTMSAPGFTTQDLEPSSPSYTRSRSTSSDLAEEAKRGAQEDARRLELLKYNRQILEKLDK